MNLYQQLQADPTLRVQSPHYGLSEHDGINLLNIRKDYPIEVTFEDGSIVCFSENGYLLESDQLPTQDIAIYETRKGNS